MRVFILALIILILFINLKADPVLISGGTGNDYESWISRLNEGRLLVIFDRNPDWASGDLYATFSENDGDSWSEPFPIIADPGDQATLSFGQYSDSLLRLWYASNESGLYKIYSAFSNDGSNWQREGMIDLGWDDNDRYYDPTIIIEEDDSVTMSYVYFGGGAYVAHCSPSGEWDIDKTLVAEGAFRARITKCMDGTYLLCYHKRTGGQYNYDIFIQTSPDLESWTEPLRMTFNMNSHDPFAGIDPEGMIRLYYAKHDGNAYNLCYQSSTDLEQWSEEIEVTFDNTNNTQPHFFSEDDDLYLIWAHAVSFPYNHDVYLEKFNFTSFSEDNHKITHRFSLFPNPCQDRITLSAREIVTYNFDVNIYDIKGRLIAESSFSDGRDFPLNLDMSDLTPGFYFFQVKTGIIDWNSKIIITK